MPAAASSTTPTAAGSAGSDSGSAVLTPRDNLVDSKATSTEEVQVELEQKLDRLALTESEEVLKEP